MEVITPHLQWGFFFPRRSMTSPLSSDCPANSAVLIVKKELMMRGRRRKGVFVKYNTYIHIRRYKLHINDFFSPSWGAREGGLLPLAGLRPTSNLASLCILVPRDKISSPFFSPEFPNPHTTRQKKGGEVKEFLPENSYVGKHVYKR